MHRHFTQADYETALAHELERLRKAAERHGLTPVGYASIRWIEKKPGRARGHWALRLRVKESTYCAETDAYGSLDITANAPTLGAVFEAAHLRALATGRDYHREAA
jgi:hypothetical protein